MYSPAVVADRLERLLASPIGQALPGHRLQRLPAPDCHSLVRQLAPAFHPKRGMLRGLTRDEEWFIHNEQLLTKLDFTYWAERYATIIRPDVGLSPLYPLWESQRLILAALAREEERRWKIGHPDGLLANCLKARQLGASTLASALIAHRTTTQSYTFGMLGSDVPENSGSTGLFGKVEQIVEHLPWWLHPRTKFHQKDQHLVFANHSSLLVESGKSMKGGLQDQGQAKGQIGRSKTYSVVWLSELSTWERPEQIDDSLLWAVPATPRTLCFFESTAKGRGNWWHRHWDASEEGTTRFFNVFIPWYAERSKYWLPPPEGWEPSATTRSFAARAEREGPKWMYQPVRLSKEQLYWYEVNRAGAEAKDELYKFLEEMPAEPEESFQYSGRSIFPPAVIDRIQRAMRPLKDLYVVAPATFLHERHAYPGETPEDAVALLNQPR